MPRLVRIILVCVSLALWVCGSPEQPAASPSVQDAAVPDTVTIETARGTVTLPHLDHARRFHCAICHSEVNPGKIAWDKATVHAYCRNCHETEGNGPTSCTACHRE